MHQYYTVFCKKCQHFSRNFPQIVDKFVIIWYTISGKEVDYMLTICKNNKEKIKKLIENKSLRSIVISNSDLIDDIILSMCHDGVIDCLANGFSDKRRHNSYIPFKLIIAMSIAAKMKIHTSLTDIPAAIQDHRVLAEIGYNLVNDDKEDFFTEGTIRYLLSKYSNEDLIAYYNSVVKNHIMPLKDIKPNVHILDCTKIAVNFDNENYENSTVARDRKGDAMRGYKLSSLRGLYNDTGIIEEIRFGTAATHDLALSEEMLKTTKCFNRGDILINDRGFLSRELINYLKIERGVDTYVPLRNNMTAFYDAVGIAKRENNWSAHPNRRRINQKIALVSNVTGWDTFGASIDVPINACVVWDIDDDKYIVISTTNTKASAREIVSTYELRPEIEEDFRQLKDFWKIEDFKTTKYNLIAFHIVCVLLGYLFYQLYINSADGSKYLGKSLPVILKNYNEHTLNHLVLYGGKYFCCMSMIEFFEFRDSCSEEVKKYLLEFFK